MAGEQAGGAFDDGGDAGEITSVELEAVRALLRSHSPADRRCALSTLSKWNGRALTQVTASAVLHSATIGYAWIDGAVGDAGELFVELLWRDPHQVDLAEIERSYAMCADRARRALLHLVALRGDREGVDLLCSLLGRDGPWDLLPIPTSHLLTPILDTPSSALLCDVLVDVAGRRGWAPHASELLVGMIDAGYVDEDAANRIAVAVSPLVMDLVDACDRVAGVGTFRPDAGRVERRRLDALLPLVSKLGSSAASATLRRALGSADPRVGATAVVALVSRGELVPDDRIAVLAKDPEARDVLVVGLSAIGRHFLLPEDQWDETVVAQAAVVRWLASETQLCVAPDDVEHRAVVWCPVQWGVGNLHVFAFRVRPPHWSAPRGWMIAVVGPFDPHSAFVPRRAAGFGAYSLYMGEDSASLEGHVQSITQALTHMRRGEVA